VGNPPKYFAKEPGLPGLPGDPGGKGATGDRSQWRLYIMGDHPNAIPGETYSDPSVGDGWLAMGDAYLTQAEADGRYAPFSSMGVQQHQAAVPAGDSVSIIHNLHSRDVTVQVYRVSDGRDVAVEVQRSDADTVVLHFGAAVAAGEYRVVIQGMATTQRDVRSFGAVGDGFTDDQDAIQAALDSLDPGTTLLFPSGFTFCHSDILRVTVPGTTLAGGGTIEATNQERAAIWVRDVDNVTIENLNITNIDSDHRWAEWEQVGLLLMDTDGSKVNYVRINSSSAAGIQIEHASNFRITHVLCEDTWSDAIHMTGGSTDGYVADAEIRRPGDDGVACVSYRTSAPNSDILVERAQVYDQVWGRALSVVGGERITYRDIRTERSAAAAIYIACEGNYDTWGVSDILIEGAEIIEANTGAPDPDHGAVMIYNGNDGQTLTDITLRDIQVTNTDDAATKQIGVIQDDPAFTVQRLSFEDFVVVGGTPTTLYSNCDPSTYNIVSANVDGVDQPDHIGWT